MTDKPENIIPITPDARSAAEKFGAEHDRELLTILFTDLVDSTKLQSDAGNVEAARLTELHRKIVREELARYDAREIEWAGDSCLAVFNSPSDAVVFALRMQAEHRRVREVESKLPLVRLGIHLGEIIVKRGDNKDDLFGLQVSEAARIMSLARGDQIFCIRSVFDNARNALRGTNLQDLTELVWCIHGQYNLKGSEHPVEICEVREQGFPSVAPPEVNEKCQKVGPATRPVRAAILGLALGGSVSLAAILIILNYSRGDDSNSRARDGAKPPDFVLAPELRPAERLSLSLPYDRVVARPGRTSYSVAISPDGMRVAYVTSVSSEGAAKALALRALNDLDPKILAGTEGARNPFFSPDGEWIGFFTIPGGELKKTSVHGGEPVTLCSAPFPLGAYWGKDGFITFAAVAGSGVMRVPETGGEALTITTLDTDSGERVHMFPADLPGDKAILVTTGTAAQIASAQVQAINLETGERTLIADKAVRGRFVPTGHIVYVQEGAFMAVPFSPETLMVTGPPFDITEKRMAPNGRVPTQFEFSVQGSLTYVPHDEESTQPHSLVWVNREGEEEKIQVPPKPYFEARLSPDNTQIATQFTGSHEIWTIELARGIARPFTDNSANDTGPVWAPAGDAIAFSSDRDAQMNIYVSALRATRIAERLFSSSNIYYPAQWIARGQQLIVQTQRPRTGHDIEVLSIDDPSEPRPLAATRFTEYGPAVSHDGRWLAYSSDESGKVEIYVQLLDDATVREQVSTSGGKQALWNPTKHEVFYRDGDYFNAVDVAMTNGTISVSSPRALFEDSYYGYEFDRAAHDISADGERFLMIRGPEEMDPRAHAEGTELVIVQNWFNLLRRLKPGLDEK